ncbi:MAG: sulfatase-like hydrolase/transferase [Bdellovibrionota bacterium]
MLTLKSWRAFWLTHFFGILIFFIPIVSLTVLFSSGFVYLGEDTTSLFTMVVKAQPYLVLSAALKIMGLTLIICCALHFFSLSFKYKYKVIFGFIFFLCVLLRIISFYPAIAEKWFVVHNFEFMRQFVQDVSMLSLNSKLRSLINWSPLLCGGVVFIINFFNYMQSLMKQGRIVQKTRNSIYIDELDIVSKTFSIQGLSFLLFFIFGGVFLTFLNASLNIKLPKNNTKQSQPNIFIFAADSLRYDRLSENKYAKVMPYLTSQLQKASLFGPMLVGIPRTFPSWVEIASGVYSLKTGVRTMFPSKSSREGKKNTIFELAKQNGYSTLFISDFAGDIFPRYPFGGTLVDAPTSNLKTLVENGIITVFSPIQAVLVLPNLQRILPALLESPEIADPRLVASAISKNLSLVANLNKPVFLTAFFSSAHFPYASPGPWYGKFQTEPMAFQKIPDQVVNKNASYTLNHPSTQMKEQTIALYNGGLNSIDFVLEKLMGELENKGWLNNSIILIFGDHGENLYDGDMGMGHGDGVEGEFSNVTPLVIFTRGQVQPNQFNINPQHLIKTVDIAPTLAKRLNFKFDYKQSDGVPLLDKVTDTPDFPENNAYMETGIWFNSGKFTPENQPRIIYPGVAALVDIDPSMDFEFYLRPSYYQAIPGVKERAWINSEYRLVVRTTKIGAGLSLYSRADRSALHDLISNPEYMPIANKMLNELNHYLLSSGVEIIPNSNGSFFYAENITQ